MIWRGILVGMLCAVASPIATAQQGQKVYRVGVLTPSATQWQPMVFRQALHEMGYQEPSNLALIVRDANGRLDALTTLAEQLVRDKVDVLVAVNTPGTRAAMSATKTIPIVMSVVGDPLATGFVTNLSRPGGNVTGVSNLNREITAKRLQLLKEAVPALARVAVFFHPDDPITTPQVRDTEVAAARLGVEVRFFPIRTSDDLREAFAALSKWRGQAVLRLAGQAFALSKPTADLALKHSLPTMLLTKEDVGLGALMAYDADRTELFRRTAYFVDKILKGANPGELPVEQPTKFELSINMKTARSLGLAVPPSLLLRVDHVVER